MTHQSDRWKTGLLGAAAAGLVGYAAAALTIPSAEPEKAESRRRSADAARIAGLQARIAGLEQTIETARADNEALRNDLDWMSKKLDATAAGVETLLETDATGVSSTGSAAAAHSAAPAGPRPAAWRGTLNTDAMVSAGFDPSDVEAYQTRIADLEMDRLYLADQAAREGWLNTPRFREETVALNDEVSGTREEFGDDLYDWALYSSGRMNRVQVASVISGSPAADVGLAEGDIIYAYSGDRVLSVTDLKGSILEGDAGEIVRVQVMRDGERVPVTVPRGPLGVRLRPLRVEPRPPGGRGS